MPTPESIQRAAQLWCEPQHSAKEMDASFAESIAALLDEARAEERAVLTREMNALKNCEEVLRNHTRREPGCGSWVTSGYWYLDADTALRDLAFARRSAAAIRQGGDDGS